MSAELRTLLAMGQKAQREGRLEDAERAFRQLLRVAPRNGDLLHALGIVRMQRGAVGEGVSHIDKALRHGADRAEVRLNLARGYHALGRYQQAATAAEKAIRQQPDAAEGYLVLGWILAEVKDWRRALGAWQRALERTPENLDARLGAARAWRELEHEDNALAELERCHEQAPDDPRVRLEYGRVLADRAGSEPEARALVEPLVDHPRYRHGARWAMSRVEDNLEHPERALAWLEPVREELGQVPEQRKGVAQYLFLNGDRAGAVDEIRAVLGSADDYVAGWFELARFDPGAVADAELERIGQLAERARAKEAIDDQVLLGYARAWALEAREQWTPAFEALKAANDLQAEQTPYKREEMETQQRRRFEYFGGDFHERARRPDETDVAPVFVMGMPRAGTTWVEQVLARHPAVTPTGENLAFERMRSKGIEVFGREPVEDPAALVAEVVEQYLDYNRRAHGVTGGCFVDTGKMAHALMPLLAAAFPEARFIHVRREPMDVGLECYRKYFRTPWPLSYRLDACAHAQARLEKEVEHWRPLVADRFMRVDFEALLEDYETTARRLLDFAGLEWVDSVLALHRDGPAPGGGQGGNRERLAPGHVGLWHRYARQLEPLRRALEDEGLTVPPPADGPR